MDVISVKTLLLLTVLCLNKCLSLTKIYPVESDKVCSQIKKRHIHLGKYNNSAAILKETRYFDTWLGDYAFTCQIKVEAPSLGGSPFQIPSVEGVIAVIQNLTLRKDQATGECIDYIQFKSDEEKSIQYCGEISTTTTDSDVSSHIAPNTFIDPRGRLDVLISIAKQKLEPGEKIDFTIAFTAFKQCFSNSDYYMRCGDDDDDRYEDRYYCIWKHLFRDGIVNCPLPGCVDEGGCKLPRVVIDHGNGTAVTVGALATVILIFICFLAALWILRKLHMICWSPPANNSRPAVVQFSEYPLGQVSASSPVRGVEQEPDTPDKDPPPAYDSLFPPIASAPSIP